VLPANTAAAVAESAHADGVRIGLLTLGCDKNTVDSERLLARLVAAGAELAPEPNGADVVIVNTCGFIDAAKEESIETILDALRLKRQGDVRAVVAVGCLVQRYKTELQQELPEVDLFLGLTEVDQPCLAAGERSAPAPGANLHHGAAAAAALHAYQAHILPEGERGVRSRVRLLCHPADARQTPLDTARRVAGGSGGARAPGGGGAQPHQPGHHLVRPRRAARHERGRRRILQGRPFAGMAGSHAPADVVRKAPAAERERRGLLPDLLRRLLAETRIPWFRLFYMYPSGIQRELVELMAQESRLVPYLDLPVQHGADSVLRRMRRPERRATIVERVGWLRSALPRVTLRTTAIVGFPGETEAEYAALLELLEEVRFDRVGAFAYSEEEGTVAAAMPGQLPDTVKRERLEQLLEVQRGITLERNEQWVGREVDVLIDSVTGRDGEDGTAHERGAIGRTSGQALEVDGVVHLVDGRARGRVSS
jgi:ribosomal protein S12 methylthiotransferase